MTDKCGTGKTVTAAPREPVFELRASDPLALTLVQLWVAVKSCDYETAIAAFALLCEIDAGDMDNDTLAEAKRRVLEMLNWHATGDDADRFQAALDRMNAGGLGGSGVPGDV